MCSLSIILQVFAPTTPDSIFSWRRFRHSGCPSALRSGFTLIELLIAVSIIAILIALLLPTLAMARRDAQSVVCASNLRQFGVAYTEYFAEESAHGLPYDPNLPTMYWLELLGPYFTNQTPAAQNLSSPSFVPASEQAALVCPSTPNQTLTAGAAGYGDAFTTWGPVAWWNQPTITSHFGSYCMNGWLFDTSITATPADPNPMYWYTFHQRLGLQPYFSYGSQLPGPQTPVFADAIWADAWPDSSDQPPQAPFTLNTGYPTGAPSGPGGLGRLCIDRHGLAINVSFEDGHVALTSLPQLWMLPWSATSSPRQVSIP